MSVSQARLLIKKWPKGEYKKEGWGLYRCTRTFMLCRRRKPLATWCQTKLSAHPTSEPEAQRSCAPAQRRGVVRDGDLRGVPGRPQDALQVAVVDAIPRIRPYFLVRRYRLAQDMRREDAVVVDVVEVFRFLAGHGDLAQPLDHPAADVPWDEQTDRVPRAGSRHRREEYAVLSSKKSVKKLPYR